MNERLTTKEAAQVKNVTPRAIRKWIKQGRLPARKYGRDWLIWRQDLEGVYPGKPGWKKGRQRN